MVYLIAKRFEKSGCIALDVTGREDVASLVNALDITYAEHNIQFVVLGNPTVYGEYAPYNFVSNEAEFRQGVRDLLK